MVTTKLSMSYGPPLRPKWHRSCQTNRQIGSRQWLTRWLRAYRSVNGSSPKKSVRTGSHKIRIIGERMKKYVKPSLKGLGLLRVVTKFSRCVAEWIECRD